MIQFHKQHKIAMKHPCLLACETMHPRYRVARKNIVVIITVNTGWQ